ncbi:MAG: nucleotidyltransferase family protein [archaeon]|nr:MAG: nucleotidyltransferase family protein [archaeon]
MKAVVLAAGEGRRMKPACPVMPKMMMPFHGKAFLEYILKELKEAGITEVVVVVHPSNGHYIRNHFSDGKAFGMKMEYAVQKERKGPAHAIAVAKELIDTEYFLVHYGDSMTNVNLPKKLMENFMEDGLDAYLALREVKEASRYGIVKFEADEIVDIVEKPPKGTEPSKIATIGIFIMKTRAYFDSIRDVKFERGREEFPVEYILRKKGRVKGWIFSGKRVDLGKPSDINTAKELISEKLELNL